MGPTSREDEDRAGQETEEARMNDGEGEGAGRVWAQRRRGRPREEWHDGRTAKNIREQ